MLLLACFTVPFCLNACGAGPTDDASYCIAAAYDEAELTCYAEVAERCDTSEVTIYYTE